MPSSSAFCLIDSSISLRYFLAALQVSVINKTPSASLAIVNSLAWGILASRSCQLGYIIEFMSRHLSSICLPVWKDRRMLSLRISLVPSTDRMQESRVTCLKPPSLAILRILFWNSFYRLAVPSECCLRNLGALANSSEANSLVRYEKVPWNKQMNSTPCS